MGLFRPKWVVPVAEYLLKRPWGRKLMADATEHMVKEEVSEAFSARNVNHVLRAAANSLVAPVLFTVGLVDAWLHPSGGPARLHSGSH